MSGEVSSHPADEAGWSRTHEHDQGHRLKCAHPVVHASYAAAGGASLASNNIIDISSTPSTPICDNMLHTRIKGVDSGPTASASSASRPPAHHMYHTYDIDTRHEQIEGGIAHIVSDLMLGQGAEGSSSHILREAQRAQRGDGERREREERKREFLRAA